MEFTGGSDARVTSIKDPISETDVANKRYVDRVKPVIAVVAETVGGLTADAVEFSFGGGLTHSKSGFCMPCPGRVLRMSISIPTNASAVASSETILRVNEVDILSYNLIVGGLFSGSRPFAVPYELNTNDRVNFKSGQTRSAPVGAVVSALIELDL